MNWLVLLLVLACPLMHLFMHRGHGHPAKETVELPENRGSDQE